MSISRQTLSAVIVTFKSDQVIHDCIQSISDQIKIIVVDNSNDRKLKENEWKMHGFGATAKISKIGVWRQELRNE